MAQYIVGYDLSSNTHNPHAAFIEQAGMFGWVSYALCSDGTIKKLPNTTLIGDFENQQAALNSFNAAAQETQRLGYVFAVSKCFLAQYANSIVSSDETITPNR